MADRSILGAQKDALVNMLHTAVDEEEGKWKVLVFDELCMDIIHQVFKVADLHRLGITLLLPIHAKREPILDAPAVYFVSPTQDNIHRIAQDAAAPLYAHTSIQFVRPAPQHILRSLAHALLPAASPVQQVHDQFLDFVCEEPDLLSLRQPAVFRDLHTTRATEDSVDHTLRTAASGIASAILTYYTEHQLPLVVAHPDGCAPALARILVDILRDRLAAHPVSVSGQRRRTLSVRRPVVILADRTVDLVSLVQHRWSYRGLVHDVLHLHNRRITVTPPPSSGRTDTAPRTYDVSVTDPFWLQNADQPFHEVAGAAEETLQQYERDKAEFTRRTGVDINEATGGVSGAEGVGEGSGEGSEGMSARDVMRRLPELVQRKREIDMHMNTAVTLTQTIKDRALDEFYSIEESIVENTSLDRQLLSSLLFPTSQQLQDDSTPSSKGTPSDRERLYLVLFLSGRLNNFLSSSDAERIVRILEEDSQDGRFAAALRAVRRLHFAGVTHAAGGSARGTSGSMLDTMKLFGKAISFVGAQRKKTPLTRMAEEVLRGDSGTRYTVLDPVTGDAVNGLPGAATDGMVFVAGGGSYVEYENLKQLEGDPDEDGEPARRLVYGCTELQTGEAFLQQLAELGREQ